MKVAGCTSMLVSGVKRTAVWVLCSIFLSSCAIVQQHQDRMTADNKVIDASYLRGVIDAGDRSDTTTPESGVAVNVNDESQAFRPLRSLPSGESDTFSDIGFSKTLSGEPSLEVKVDKMPIIDFIHYALGDLLGVDYIIDPAAQKSIAPVTLASAGLRSPQWLYGTVMQVLGKNGLSVDVTGGNHVIFKVDKKNSSRGVTINAGTDPGDVPQVAGDILQIVPLKYGTNLSLERTLRELLDVTVSVDNVRNTLFLRGVRSEVVKGLSFIAMFDAPANRGRHIGIVNLTYLSAKEFMSQISSLMKAEGIPVGAGDGKNESVVIVPLPNIGSSAVFASSQTLLDRVRYWATLVDQPAAGATSQYFVFTPKFARASEIGESLIELVGGGRGRAALGNGVGATAGERTGQAPNASRSQGLTTEALQMVVVERSNSLVFNTTGAEYQRLLPLLEQLDVLPKQVLLDIVIAEVTLKDEFKFGVEWAFENGKYSGGTAGGLGASQIVGTAFSFSEIDRQIYAQMLQTSQLVNVLSNPTMLVRDGVQANINIGSDIAVVGATTFDPLVGQRQTTASVYRKTGVDVTITPTVNAKGVVLMQVDQKISNAVPNSSGAAGNPDIFERSISTEIVAGSGQTVLLGGLISEDVSASGASTPLLSSLPGLGWLFRSEGDSGTRTELVMFVTARIMDDLDAWNELEKQFSDGLKFLDYSSS